MSHDTHSTTPFGTRINFGSIIILFGKPEGKWPLGKPMHRLDTILKFILTNGIGGYRLD